MTPIYYHYWKINYWSHFKLTLVAMCLTSQKPLPWYIVFKNAATIVAGSHLRPVKCHVAFWRCNELRLHGRTLSPDHMKMRIFLPSQITITNSSASSLSQKTLSLSLSLSTIKTKKVHPGPYGQFRQPKKKKNKKKWQFQNSHKKRWATSNPTTNQKSLGD